MELALGIETTCPTGGVALVSLEGVLAETNLTSSRTHSNRLLPALEWLLQQTGVVLSQIDLIGVSCGPGSFTGIRIGLATGKGLAFGLGIPVASVPTLDALAHGIHPCPGTVACPLLDARRGQVYGGVYVPDGSGKGWRLTGDYFSVAPGEVARRLPGEGRVLFLGDGACKYSKKLEELFGERACLLDPLRFYPRAATVGALALARGVVKATDGGEDSAAAIYVRASEAEEKRKAGVLRRGLL